MLLEVHGTVFVESVLYRSMPAACGVQSFRNRRYSLWFFPLLLINFLILTSISSDSGTSQIRFFLLSRKDSFFSSKSMSDTLIPEITTYSTVFFVDLSIRFRFIVPWQRSSRLIPVEIASLIITSSSRWSTTEMSFRYSFLLSACSPVVYLSFFASMQDMIVR